MPAPPRKALVVGIDGYEHLSPLYGCVNDAERVAELLGAHADGAPNFDIELLRASDAHGVLGRDTLRERIMELFQGRMETALLYFAGHGHVEATGGYLCTTDTRHGHDGIALDDVFAFADDSASDNRIVILDSCHAGVAGASRGGGAPSRLADGVTILAASTEEQYASEEFGSGVFTTLLVDALEGAAANVVGEITAGSVYAHIDQALGSWQQRPVFKTNVRRFNSLRDVAPTVAAADLRRLAELFPREGFEFRLDPTYEPERTDAQREEYPDPVAAHTEVFALLQSLVRVNLVRPHGASKPHMWHAAMESKCCVLTPLGEHYRRLAQDRRI